MVSPFLVVQSEHCETPIETLPDEHDTDSLLSVGTLAAGSVASQGASGWRNLFWIQAALMLITSLGFLFFYWPARRSDYPKMSMKEYLWSLDPVGLFLFISGSTLTLLALDWAGSAFPWANAHVSANLTIGLVLLVLFCLYGESACWLDLWIARC
jgi:MFS family permease